MSKLKGFGHFSNYQLMLVIPELNAVFDVKISELLFGDFDFQRRYKGNFG